MAAMTSGRQTTDDRRERERDVKTGRNVVEKESDIGSSEVRAFDEWRGDRYLMGDDELCRENVSTY